MRMKGKGKHQQSAKFRITHDIINCATFSSFARLGRMGHPREPPQVERTKEAKEGNEHVSLPKTPNASAPQFA